MNEHPSASAALAPEAEKPGYEVKDASIPFIVVAAAAIAAGVLAVLLVAGTMYWRRFFNAISAGPRQTAFSNSASLRSSIENEWQEIDRVTKKNLESYGWIDRAHGIVRIPIERAMELTLQEPTNTSAKNTAPAASR